MCSSIQVSALNDNFYVFNEALTFEATPDVDLSLANAFVLFNLALCFHVRGKTGVDVSSISSHSNEAEILFAPGTLFRVVSVTKRASNDWTLKPFTEVVLEEISAYSL